MNHPQTFSQVKVSPLWQPLWILQDILSRRALGGLRVLLWLVDLSFSFNTDGISSSDLIGSNAICCKFSEEAAAERLRDTTMLCCWQCSFFPTPSFILQINHWSKDPSSCGFPCYPTVQNQSFWSLFIWFEQTRGDFSSACGSVMVELVSGDRQRPTFSAVIPGVFTICRLEGLPFWGLDSFMWKNISDN